MLSPISSLPLLRPYLYLLLFITKAISIDVFKLDLKINLLVSQIFLCIFC